MRKITYIIGLTLIISFPFKINAQQFLNNDNKNNVSVSLGYKNSLYSDIQYCRILSDNFLLERPLQLQGNLGFPVMINPIKNNLISIGAFSLPKENHKTFDIVAGFVFDIKNANDALQKATNISAEVILEPGIYEEKYFFAAHTAFDYSIANHMTFKSLVQNTFNDLPSQEAPENGWYKSHYIAFNLGVHVGFLIFRKCTIELSAGYKFYTQKQDLNYFIYTGNIPFYGNLKVGYNF